MFTTHQAVCGQRECDFSILGRRVKAENAGDDPRATGGLVSNLPHPRVNKTKQHTTPHGPELEGTGQGNCVLFEAYESHFLEKISSRRTF